MKYYKIQWYDSNGNTDGSTFEDYEHNLFTTPQQAKDFLKHMYLTDEKYAIIAYTIIGRIHA